MIAPLPDLLQETSLLGGLFLATLIMARIERRSVFSYGFQDERKLTRLVSGTIVGFLVVSGLVGLLWITGALAFDGISIHGLLAWKYAALWFAAFLVVGFFEEGLLRGYLQYTLARGNHLLGRRCSSLCIVWHASRRQPGRVTHRHFECHGGGLVFCRRQNQPQARVSRAAA